MWSKVKPSSLSPLSTTVLNNTNPGGLGTMFSGTSRRTMELEKTVHIPVKKATVSFTSMLSSLPSEKDMVHRGMAGLKEVESIATHGKFGAGKYTKRPYHLDIAQFIHDPKCCMFLSTSPDPHTVKEYMIGFQLITAKGAITSMCLPSVYIRPQTARHVDEDMFRHYQKVLEFQVEHGNRTQSEDILRLAEGNNETTAILGETQKDDWRPKFHLDLHSMVLVRGAGKIMSGFTKADTIDTVTIVNPHFRKRIMAIEIFSTALGSGAMYDKYFAKMNDRAKGLGLINSDNRMLTLRDASDLMNSPEYQELLEKYQALGETMVLQSVPKNIRTTEELVKFVAFLIESNPAKAIIETPSPFNEPKI
ncbi:hypothetical protein FOLKNPGA_00015 [Legionella sp. PC1000]|uniref:hypothetical protein n=1 Tax=Legionella sp. PC1000 TaxID=2746060 RepID=UPI0015FB06E0|nr:hypothetical protein [Legionella sp. PC1000]QLZ67250.1 hypothetical protein FOLKNPGA_00015 [Legionella sp. PC1000]